MEDEAFFMHDVITGRKHWSPRGQRIGVPLHRKPQEDHGVRIACKGSVTLWGYRYEKI